MENDRKRFNLIIAIFCLLVLVAMSALSWICYVTFDQNYREIKQQYYAAVTGQVIADMETSIRYGKRIDRYFGIEGVFENTVALFDEPMTVAIIQPDGAPLYELFEADAPESALMRSTDAASALADLGPDAAYTFVGRGGYEALLIPIHDETDATCGVFALIYPTSVYDAQRAAIAGRLLVTLGISIGVTWLILLVYRAASLNFFATPERRTYLRNRRLFILPTFIVMVCILALGIVSFMVFQEEYSGALQADAQGIVRYVVRMLRELSEKGVPYSEMSGLAEYLADKVGNIPLLSSLRVSRVLSDSASVMESSFSSFISLPVGGSGGDALYVEAFLSDSYVREKLLTFFLTYFATFIFCFVIIVELTRLPLMIDHLRARRAQNQDKGASYEHISSGLRIGSFLRSMANYLYLPYSAMLIRQLGQGAFGLNVGVTAALPLTLEGAGQVLGILIYPMLFKQPDRRGRLFFAACLTAMIAVNTVCFLTHSAVTIILMRLIGGFAYSGFMHMINMVVAAGDDGEERRQVNLAQSNAGVIGGIMCGAGIGAVIASISGFAATYLISSAVFLAFGAFILIMMPWKLLEENAARAELERAAAQVRQKASEYLRVLVSPQLLRFFLLVIVPVNFGILYVVTLIPTMVDATGNTILLSYCYVVNGIAGFYIGPKLVSVLGKKFSNSACLVFTLVIAAAALVLLNVPPFMIMVLLSSAMLGIFDGFGSPMTTDGFLGIPAVAKHLPQVSALSVYFLLCNLVTVFAPVLIEIMTQGDLTLSVFALTAAYLAVGVLFAIFSGISGRMNVGKGAGSGAA